MARRRGPALTRKAFAALRYLVAHAGQLVTKDELIAAVWAVPYVSDMALAACIREIRRALGRVGQDAAVSWKRCAGGGIGFVPR